MSETRAFDTHAAVKVLTDAGARAKPELAEAFVAGEHGRPRHARMPDGTAIAVASVAVAALRLLSWAKGMGVRWGSEAPIR